MRGLAGNSSDGDLQAPDPAALLAARTVRVVGAMAMAGGALSLLVQTTLLGDPALESFVKANFMSDE